MENSPDELQTANYCLSFIDLLGQREKYKGQNLLRTELLESDEAKKNNYEAAKKAIHDIRGLQKIVAKMKAGFEETGNNWRATQTQHWSDGLVQFVRLEDEEMQSSLRGIYSILCSAAVSVFVGLVYKNPMRGAIDIGWGMELPSGGLYGPIIANAYEIENSIAQYPRIVVHHRVVDYLQSHSNKPDNIVIEENRMIAQSCLNMLRQDEDGFMTLHYLNKEFQQKLFYADYPSPSNSFQLKAYRFVIEQREKHKQSGNSKLALRYGHLARYFDAHPVSS